MYSNVKPLLDAELFAQSANSFNETGLIDAELYAEAQNVEMDERTMTQIYGVSGVLSDAELLNDSQASYKTYREMRADPTIAFARMLCIAPLVTVGWSYVEKDGAPEGAKDLIEEQMEPWRTYLMKCIMEGYIDFGWTPFEVVPKIEAGRVLIKKFKQLLQDQTRILVKPATGEYIGLRQYNYFSAQMETDLGVYDSLHVALDVEGTNWYGRPLMENAIEVYNQWKQVNESANKYDTKVAGASWVVHYPVGKSDFNGALTNNYTIAQTFLALLQSNGKIAVPVQVSKYVTGANEKTPESPWKIELISDNGVTQAGFIDRQKYLDTLKVRAFGFPERSILEGDHGTKAEAGEHANFAIQNFEMRHQVAVEQINRQSVDWLLETNYGREHCGCVCIQPRPLIDSKRALLEKIYMGILVNPDGIFGELQALDMQTFRKQLDLPEMPVNPMALPGMPATNGLLTEFFNEMNGVTTTQPGTGSVTGPALGVVPPEYWADATAKNNYANAS